jgi:hypothetical protein
MNLTDFQSILLAVLREQEQCFVQLLSALCMGQGTLAAIMSPAQGNLPLPQLPDIESFVMNLENLTHFDDWL